jgi:oligosaccharide repeat unit polymerase
MHTFFVPDFKFSYSTGFILDALIIFFFIGEFTVVVASIRFKKKKTNVNLQDAAGKKLFEKKLRRVIKVLGFISIVGSLMYFYVFYKYFGSLIKLFTAGWLIRSELAEGLITVPLIIRVMALMAYSALILSLVYWVYFKFKWFLTVPFVSMLIMGIAQAARAGTFMMLIMIFIAGYWRDKLNGVRHIGVRLFKRIALFSLTIIVIFTLGLAYREQNFNIEFFNDRQLKTYNSYAFGSISGFSVFWDQYSLDTDLTLGLYSFSSLFELLGIKKLAAGFYDDYLFISNSGNEQTNVYTLFRSLIEDFSVPGAFIYMFILGVIFSYAFKYAIKGNMAALSLILISYTMIVYSVIAPLTQHNTILLSFVMPPLILWVISKNSHHKLKKSFLPAE